MGFPFTYVLGPDAVEVRLGPWVARKVDYRDIEAVSPGYPFWNEHWTNLYPWRFLAIRRRGGVIKNFVINPPEREAFARDLRARAGLPSGGTP